MPRKQSHPQPVKCEGGPKVRSQGPWGGEAGVVSGEGSGLGGGRLLRDGVERSGTPSFPSRYPRVCECGKYGL